MVPARVDVPMHVATCDPSELIPEELWKTVCAPELLFHSDLQDDVTADYKQDEQRDWAVFQLL